MTLAHDMGIDDLKTACEDHIIATLSVENSCKYLISALDNGKWRHLLANIYPNCQDSFDIDNHFPGSRKHCLRFPFV